MLKCETDVSQYDNPQQVTCWGLSLLVEKRAFFVSYPSNQVNFAHQQISL